MSSEQMAGCWDEEDAEFYGWPKEALMSSDALEASRLATTSMVVVGEPEDAECPVCYEMGTMQHGYDDLGRPRHYWDCPNCGVSMPIVGYYCADCQAALEEQEDGRE